MSESPTPPDSSTDITAEEAQPFVITLPDDPSSGRDWYLWAAVLALIALIAFWPAINGTFLWDDDQYVTQNRALLDAQGLKQIWKVPPGTIQYYPLTFTLFWIEHHFWANNSLGYRVVNLLLHAGAAIILWRILRRLSIPAAWAAAAIWAVHPLQVESVCWISESKNVLSGILALASTLFYLEFAGLRDPDAKKPIWNLPEDWQIYLISAVFFLLAMFAKTTVCFLPVAIFIVLWWKRRNSLATILGLLPMLVIGAALAFETSRLETDPNGAIRASGPDWQLSFAQRLMISGRDLWFYVGKLLAPIHQSFIYPRHVPDAANTAEWGFLIAAVAVLIGLAIGIKKFGAGPLAAALCYVAAIFPALAFFNVYPFRFSFVADHFQYLAGIPLIVLAVSIVTRGLSGSTAERKRSPAVAAVLISLLLVLLGTVSWIRADVFAEPSTLWADVLQPDKNPDSWMAAYNLAKIRQGDAVASFNDAARFLQGGDQDLSMESAKDALALMDDSDRLLGDVLGNPKSPADVLYMAHDQFAENDITRMRSPDSDSTKLLEHAGNELKSAFTFDAARSDPLPYYTQGLVYLNRAQQLQKRSAPMSIATATTMPTTRPNTLAEQEYIDLYNQARDSFEQAFMVSTTAWNSPALGAEALRVLPLAAFQRGNIDWTLAEQAQRHENVNLENQLSRDAAIDYSRAVQFNPSSVDSRYHLALALENVGALPAAREQLMTILRDLDHFNAPAYNEIGVVIMESRPTDVGEYEAALESFRAALKIDPNLPGAQANLDQALRMLATTRPTTRSSTMPTTQPAK